MADPTKIKNFIGKEEYYLDFCEFFEREIEKLGYEEVLQKYLVGDNEIAKDIFPRLYQGKLLTGASQKPFSSLFLFAMSECLDRRLRSLPIIQVTCTG